METKWIKNATRLLVGAAALGAASLATATAVTLSQHAAGSPPATADVRVNVFSVTPGKAVGAYDIALRYNPSTWSVGAINYGAFLSGPDPLGSIQLFDLSVAGLIQLSEISLITPNDPQPLETLQPDAFTLATIRFNAVAQGVGSFSIASAALYDQFGDPLAANIVPEPHGIAFALLGICALVTRASQKKVVPSLQLAI